MGNTPYLPTCLPCIGPSSVTTLPSRIGHSVSVTITTFIFYFHNDDDDERRMTNDERRPDWCGPKPATFGFPDAASTSNPQVSLDCAEYSPMALTRRTNLIVT